MSEQNGQLSTCERCGAQIFRKCIGEGVDSGFTRWNKFEDYPEGWGFICVPSASKKYDTRIIRVCPACHDTWNNISNEYFLRNTDDYIVCVKEEE